MKVKVSLSGDSVKHFFAAHCEKMGLAFIVLVCGYLVFCGYLQEVTDDTPDNIRNLTQKAQTNIQSTSWDAVASDRVQTIDFQERATKIKENIQVAHYVIGPFKDLTTNPRTTRSDPQLYTVEELEVTGGFEPVALRVRQTGRERPTTMTRTKGADYDEDVVHLMALPTNVREKFTGSGQKKRGAMGGTRTSGMGMGMSGNSDKAEARPFVSILGIVPLRRQMNEYKRCFKDADGYVVQRDFPRYAYHYIRRREIGPDGKPGKWKGEEYFHTLKAVTIANTWQSTTPEIADRQYLYAKNGPRGGGGGGMEVGAGGRSQWGRSWPGLHWPLPPLLLCDISPFALHSKVPAEQLDLGRMGMGRMMEEELDPNDITDDAPTAGRGRTGGFINRAGPGGMGGLGGEFGMMGRGNATEMAEHVLFRIFDFKVTPGKTYQYSVRLLVEDANNPDPRKGGVAPPLKTLDMDVIERIRKLENESPAKKHYRTTEWSSVSPPVTVPNGRNVFAGKPEPLRLIKIRDRTYPKSAARINTIGVMWDANKQLEVYHEDTVTRGSAVNMKGKDFLAINPAASSINNRKDEVHLRTDRFVLDTNGGRELPGRESDLLETSEMLVMDAHGHMSLHTEVDDFQLFSAYDMDVTEALDNMQNRGMGLGGPGGGIEDFNEGRPGRRPGAGTSNTGRGKNNKTRRRRPG